MQILNFGWFVLSLSLSLQALVHNRPHLEFDKLHTDELYFPSSFLFGFAIAEQQNSGAENCPNSNWTDWENQKAPNGEPRIKKGQKSGKACDHWNLYKTDIALMKEDFNANSFRFSVAWDRIEPEEGQFDPKALAHYSDEVNALLKAGITPMITLHHFSHPMWFERKGAFEKEENIAYFVRFSKKVFEALGDRVPLWCTINEPTIYMFQGYLPLNCVFPPAKTSGLTSWALASKVLRNMLQAHTEVYQALKSMRHGKKAQIGLVHQYLKFEPWAFFNPLEYIPGYLLNPLLVDRVIEFLKTGTFFHEGFGYSETYTAPIDPSKPAAAQISDFVGLNYYSRVLIKMVPTLKILDSRPDHDEVMTDMPYAIYAEGLYKALHHIATIGLPIYITENGIADKLTSGDARRVQWLKQYLKATSLALEDGLDIRGYYYWTLVDNFEWDMGWDSCFGCYALDRATQKRTLKEGAKVYASIIQRSRAGEFESPTRDRVLSGVPQPS
jgi:beta-glucosidase